jgi:hypothetical protein
MRLARTLLLGLVALVASSQAAHATSRIREVPNSSPYTVVTAYGTGLRITLTTPSRAYRYDATVPVIVKVENRGRRGILVRFTCGVLARLQLRTAAHTTYPPIATFGGSRNLCDHLSRIMSLQPRTVWSDRQYIHLRTHYIQAEMIIIMAQVDGPGTVNVPTFSRSLVLAFTRAR